MIKRLELVLDAPLCACPAQRIRFGFKWTKADGSDAVVHATCLDCGADVRMPRANVAIAARIEK